MTLIFSKLWRRPRLGSSTPVLGPTGIRRWGAIPRRRNRRGNCGEVYMAEPGNRASGAMPPKFCAIARSHFPYRPRIIYKFMVIGEQGNALDRSLGHKDAIEGILVG